MGANVSAKGLNVVLMPRLGAGNLTFLPLGQPNSTKDLSSTLAEAEEAITRVMVDREFGDAGDTLLIEGATPPDIMNARMLLEPMVAAEAARHADAADQADMEATGSRHYCTLTFAALSGSSSSKQRW